MTERRGPLESRPFPSQLEAFAVDASGDAPRLHGYDVERDLAEHYRFSDLVYLALVGELPTEPVGRAFEVALAFAMPVSVAEGAVHATALAAYCGAPAAGLLASASVALAEASMRSIDALLEWERVGGPLRPELLASGDVERASVERLAARIAPFVEVPILASKPSREIALAAVFRACGLGERERLAHILALARLPVALAEAARRSPKDFTQKYPVNVPPFVYER